MRSREIPEHFKDDHQVTQRSGRVVKIISTLLLVGKVRLNKMPKVRFQIRCTAGNREQAQTLSTFIQMFEMERPCHVGNSHLGSLFRKLVVFYFCLFFCSGN